MVDEHPVIRTERRGKLSQRQVAYAAVSQILDGASILGDGGPLAVGAKARIKQPRMFARVWEVTEFEPERSFTWQSVTGMLTGFAYESAVRVTLASHA